MSKIKLSVSNFNSEWKKFTSRVAKMKGDLQEFCALAMVQASGPSAKSKTGRNENMTFVNLIINDKSLVGIDRKAIQSYFEDHCDLQLVKKDGEYKFQSKRTRGFKFEMPKETWADYKPSAAPTAIDEEQAVLSLVRRLSTAVKGSSEKTFLQKGHVKSAKAILAHLAKTPGVDAEKLKKALAA